MVKMRSDEGITIVTAQKSQTFAIAELSRSLRLAKMTVDDPAYEKVKNYEGFLMEDVLRLAGISANEDEVLLFTALDGYQARLPGSMMRWGSAKGLLAIRDLDAKAGWEPIVQGKVTLSPGPFYLVWQEKKSTQLQTPEQTKLPWPYQLAKIEVRNQDGPAKLLFPNDANRPEAAGRGFKVFSTYCLACHSVNLEGGALGPELNVPQNITEYRNRQVLHTFITNPSHFRARSKMPDFEKTLSSRQIDDVLDYLGWISHHKTELR